MSYIAVFASHSAELPACGINGNGRGRIIISKLMLKKWTAALSAIKITVKTV